MMCGCRGQAGLVSPSQPAASPSVQEQRALFLINYGYPRGPVAVASRLVVHYLSVHPFFPMSVPVSTMLPSVTSYRSDLSDCCFI